MQVIDRKKEEHNMELERKETQTAERVREKREREKREKEKRETREKERERAVHQKIDGSCSFEFVKFRQTDLSVLKMD